MHAALPLVLACVSAVPELRVDERVASVLVIALPKDATPSAPTSAYLQALSSAFLAATSFELRSSEQAGFDRALQAECERGARLTCWAKAARAATPPLSAVMILGVLPIDRARDRVTLTVVEVERALAVRADDDEAREDLIYEASPRTQPVTVAAGEIDRWAAAVVEELAPKLGTAPLGRVRLTNVETGVELRVDGRAIGAAPGAEVELLDVRPGVRKISQPLGASSEVAASVTVVAGGSASAAFLRPSMAVEVDPLPRTILLWGGGATAAAGAALVVWSAAKSAGRETRCFAGSVEADCAAAPFPRFGASGPAILPIGLGLLAGGTGWAVGSVVGPPERAPWIELAVGTGIGVAAFLVGVAVDPR